MLSVDQLYVMPSGSQIPPGTYNMDNGSQILMSGETFSVTFSISINDTLSYETRHFEVGYPLESPALWDQI